MDGDIREYSSIREFVPSASPTILCFDFHWKKKKKYENEGLKKNYEENVIVKHPKTDRKCGKAQMEEVNFYLPKVELRCLSWSEVLSLKHELIAGLRSEIMFPVFHCVSNTWQACNCQFRLNVGLGTMSMQRHNQTDDHSIY